MDNTHFFEKISIKLDIPKDILFFHKLFENANHKLFLVGGSIRDSIMGIKPHDFDMVTSASPDEVIEILSIYRTDLQGVKFGIVRVFTDDCPLGYEIASYRRDISKGRDTKGYDPKVEIGNHISIKDDCLRRDITINALYYNIKTQKIVDIVGGVNDIKNNIIKAVGNPHIRFDEDRLRILRVIRFAAVTGGEIDVMTSEAIKDDNRLFGISYEDDVSRERIFLEFLKVKEKADKNGNPNIIKKFIDLLVDYGIMKQIFPVLVLDKDIKPTLNLSIAIAQCLRKNEINEDFKKILIDSKIPIKYVDAISILINLYNNSIDPENVYMIYREIKSKEVGMDTISEWIDVMGLTNKNLVSFTKYEPTTTGHDVIKDGFKGSQIGEEIRRRETEKFKNLLNTL